MHLHASTLAAAILFLPYTAARPQGPASFSELVVRVSALHVTPDRRLDDLYRARPGAGLEIETPFGMGRFTLSAARVPFRTRELPPRADFDGTLIALGWGVAVPLASPLTVTIGARAGDFLMAFHDTVIDPGVRDESELLVGAFAMASLRLPHRFGLGASASYSHVHLHVPVHLVTLAAGIEYRLETPSWLRDFLR